MPSLLPNSVRLRGRTLVTEQLDLIHSLLGADGYVYLSEVPDSFDYITELARIGRLIPQYNDLVIREVRPLDSVGEDVISASNTRELTPHTEWYEFQGIPPRYIALWCVRPASGGGGETTLADGHRFLRQFSPAEQAHLRSKEYLWRSSPSLAAHGVTTSARHPLVEEYSGRIVLRFSTHDIISPDDGLLHRFVSEGNEYFHNTKISYPISRNDVLLWDNWRIMHARNAFSDRLRHLRRVLIGGESQSAYGRQ